MQRCSRWLLNVLALLTLSCASLCVVPTASQAASTTASTKPRQIITFPTRGTRRAHTSSPNVYGSGDLQYHGGNVENTPEVFLIFWGPGWSNTSPDVQIVKNYFTDVGNTPFETILTQYYGIYGITIANTLTVGGVWLDTSTPPTDHTCGSRTIEDAALQQEISRAMTANGWSNTGTFFVYTPNGYSINDGYNECSEQVFCGYHGYNQAHLLTYAAIPYPSNLPGCGVPTSPNGDIYGDSLVNISSHEQFESITDPDVATGWYDSVGYEIGDKCAFDFSAGLTTLNNGHSYEVQTEYSNETSSCVNTFTPGAFFSVDVPLIAAVMTPGQSGWTQTVTLTNRGTTLLNWSAATLPSWVTVSPTSGSLGSYASEQLTITLNAPNSTTQSYSTKLVLTAANTVNSPFSLPITMEIANVSRQWYFAEGYTGGSFSEFLTLANTGSNTANVQVQYLLGSGTPIIKQYQVAADARYTIHVNQEIGPNQNVSMVVTADQPIIAERPMYFTYTGLPGYTIPGGSDVLGATSLSTSFDFGYLDTSPGHDTYLTILNQNSSPMTATIQYFAASGGAPITLVHTVNANSRGTVHVNAEGLAPGTYSALVSLSAPGLVERPLYLKDTTSHATGSADVVGVPAPQTDWYFAEGFTNPTFFERYIVSNPNTTGTAHVTVTFFTPSGSPVTATATLAPGQQGIINANAVLGNGNVSNSAHVSADLPILAERFISFTYTGQVGSGSSASIPGASDVLGAAAPSNLFYFSEGYTGSTFAEYLTLENPNASTATVQITFLPANGAQPTVLTGTLAPSSRATLFTNTVLPNQSFSMIVQSDMPIVAERPMYFTFTGGQTGGSDVIGYQPPGAALPPSGLSVYVGSNTYASSLDASTGAIRWSTLLNKLNGGYTSPVVVTNGVAYFTSGVNSSPAWVYALQTSDGSILWSVPITYPTGVAVSGGMVYVIWANYPANSYTLEALNATTGAVVFQQPLSVHYASDPVVANGILYFSSNNNYLYALNASDGSPLWSYQNPGSTNFSSQPVVDNGILYIGSNDGNVYALNASTGALVWQYQTGSYINTTPLIANGVLYVGSHAGDVFALRASDGTLLWQNGYYATGLAFDNGLLFVSSGSLWAFNASTGVLLWSVPMQYGSAPAAANGVVYISQQGGVYAFQESDGSLLWGVNVPAGTPTLAP